MYRKLIWLEQWFTGTVILNSSVEAGKIVFILGKLGIFRKLISPSSFNNPSNRLCNLSFINSSHFPSSLIHCYLWKRDWLKKAKLLKSYDLLEALYTHSGISESGARKGKTGSRLLYFYPEEEGPSYLKCN